MKANYWIDSHCHLDLPSFDADVAMVIDHALSRGIGAFVVPSTTRRSWQRIHALANQYTEVKTALGLHPYFLDTFIPEDLEALDSSISANEVAVGEIGLDGWEGGPDFLIQQQVFEAQVAVAINHRLPLILHTRKADEQVLFTLKRLQFPFGGIVHAFGGSEQQAQRYLDIGFKIGLGGSITYERARKVRTLAATLKDEDYVLETDSPDMPVSGFQGQRNEPAKLIAIAGVLSQLRQQEMSDIMRHSTQNVINVLPNW